MLAPQDALGRGIQPASHPGVKRGKLRLDRADAAGARIEKASRGPHMKLVRTSRAAAGRPERRVASLGGL